MKLASSLLLLVAALLGTILWSLGDGESAPALSRATVSGGAAPEAPREAAALQDEARPQVERVQVQGGSLEGGEEDFGEGVVGFHLSGHVVDVFGDVVPGAHMEIQPSREEGSPEWTMREMVSRRRRAVTSADGSYAMTAIRPGSYDVRLMGREIKKGLRIDSDLEHDLSVETFLKLGGRVVRAVEEDVRLELFKGTLAPGGVDYDRAQCELSVAEDGKFLFVGLEPSHYRIRVIGDRHADQSFFFELFESQLDLKLELEKGLTVAGRVEAGFETAGGVWVCFWHPETKQGPSARPSNGEFRFEGLFPGVWNVSLDARALEAKRRTKRRLQFVLEDDVDDFFFRVADDLPARFRVRLPDGVGIAKGQFHASCGPIRSTTPVQFSWKDGEVLHERRKEDAYGGHWSGGELLEIDLGPGEWSVQLDVLGYATWRSTINSDSLAGAVQEIDLEPLAGRLVTTSHESPCYRVEARAMGESDWELLLWHDNRVDDTHTPTPGVARAFLSTGKYDLRIECIDRASQMRRSVSIEPSLKELVLDFELDDGLAILGTVESKTGGPWSGPLYLARLEAEGRWRALPTKQHLGKIVGSKQLERIVRRYGPSSGPFTTERLRELASHFEFTGLHPGTYRASLDPDFSAIVAEWTLVDRDLVDERVVAVPFAAGSGPSPR